jgi:hypothetical protein
MRPIHRLAVAAVGVVATLAVLAAVRGVGTASPTDRPATPSPATTATAPPPLPEAATIAGPPFPATETDPTRSSAQAKAWFHDGRWWAVLWALDTGESRIHALDPGSGAWIDTGQVVDERPGSRVDVLADGDRIVVASAGTNPESARDAALIVAFDYDAEAESYRLAPDFPVPLTTHGLESVVLARDGTGRLWSAYVHQGRLLVDRTDGDDHRWLGPISPGGDGAARHATIVGLSDRVVVLSTGTAADVLEVWVHLDGDADEQWLAVRHEVRGLRAAPAPVVARAARDGVGEAVFAVTSTTLDRTDVNPLAPLVLLFRVSPEGDLRSFVFGRVADHHREPVLAIDEAADRVYVFATATFGDTRAVVVKGASLSDPVFESGLGSVFAESSADRLLSTPVSPRAPADAASGLVILAADDATDRYVAGLSAVPTAPPPALTGDRVLVDDTWEPWPAGSTYAGPWELVTDGEPSGATIEAGAGAADQALRLGADVAGRGPRACRSFAPVVAGTVAVTIDIRPGPRGASDGGVWLRGEGEQGASMRFEDTGTLSAYDGAEKARSTVAYQPTTWYRLELETDVPSRTWNWTLSERDTGRTLLTGTDLAWRSPTAAIVDELCIDAPSGGPGIEVRVDSVLVVRR